MDKTRAPSDRPILEEAFPLWLDLVGIDCAHFDRRAKKFAESMSFGDYDAIQSSLAIHECFAIPDGDLTAQLLLSRYLSDFAQGESFTLADLLDGKSEVQAKLTAAQAIRKILDREQFVFQRADFAASLAAAAAHYGVDGRDDIQEFLEDDLSLAQLRRDAYFGVDDLQVNQFLDGDPGPATRPGYNTMIRRWWRMEDLLAATAHLPEGVSLNLVCPGNEHELFFCFCVRRGARIYLLHDAPDNAHPLQGQMTRSPGRHLERRMAKFWFPYETAGVRLEDKGRRMRMEKDEQALALPGRFQEYCRPLCRVADLPPAELLWTVMMFDRIMDRFWGNQPLPSLPLSYAAGHLREQVPSLVDDARAAGLPVASAPPLALEIPHLSLADVATLQPMPEELGEVGPLHDRAWLLDRYASLVPEEAFNLVSAGQQHAQITMEGRLQVLDGPAGEIDFFERDRAPTALNQLDPTRFGTPRELAADRKFIARHNLARRISDLASREYEDSRHKIRQWLTDRYASRLPFLLSLVAHAKDEGLRIVDWQPGHGPEQFEHADRMLGLRVVDGRGQKRTSMSHELGQVVPLKSSGRSYMAPGAFTPVLNGKPARAGRPACVLTDAAPSWWFLVCPTNAVELAWLLGVSRERLPAPLRNYTSISTPHGNSILDRVDPLLWALNDPWEKFDKGVRLPLSKRGLAQLQKERSPVDLGPLHGASLRLYQGQDLLPVGIAPATPASPTRRRRRP